MCSKDTLTKVWAASKRTFQKILAKEPKILFDIMEQSGDFEKAFYQMSKLYATYCILVQDLGLVLDQTVQPQKRETIQKMIDVAVVRLRELNEELKKIDLAEFHYIDGALLELKLTPFNVEILDPFFYYTRHYSIEEMFEKLRLGEIIYVPPPPPPPEEAMPEEVEEEELPVEKKKKEKEPKDKKKAKQQGETMQAATVSPQELIKAMRKKEMSEKMIAVQRNERGRQWRLFYLEYSGQAKIGGKIESGVDIFAKIRQENRAATIIQAVYRGHRVRQWVKKKEIERRLLIGMVMPSYNKDREEIENVYDSYEYRRKKRLQRSKEYEIFKEKEKERIYRIRGPGLMEDISDEIRQWFRNFYDKAKTIDLLPPPEDGGSILIVKNLVPSPEQFLINQQNKNQPDPAAEKAKAAAEAKKLKQLEKKLKKAEAEKKKKEAENRRKVRLKGEFLAGVDETDVVPKFEAVMKEWSKSWEKLPDQDNPFETVYEEIITDQVYYDLQLELRPIVDKMMWVELQILHLAMMKDAKQTWKFTIPKFKEKKQKKKKDMTGNRTTADLFQELFQAGIIRNYNRRARLNDFIGDFGYNSYEDTIRYLDPKPNVGDIRQAVKLNCILPMCVTKYKKPRSVLILGHKQCGKKVLADAIFAETQCVLFDLSPENLKGKYTSKKDEKLLIHMIQKMSVLLQPSVIFFNRVERVFYRAVPPQEADLDPKRLSAIIFKEFIKPIKPEDKVLVLGTCSEPWVSQVPKMKKTFEITLCVPRIEYSTTLLYWTNVLMSYHGVDRNFDVSAIAKKTVGFTIPEIREAVEKVLTPKRISELYFKPLKQVELFEPFVDMIPYEDEVWAKLYSYMMQYVNEKDRVVVADIVRQKMASGKM